MSNYGKVNFGRTVKICTRCYIDKGIETVLTKNNWNVGNKKGGRSSLKEKNVKYICKDCDALKSEKYRKKTSKPHGYIYLAYSPQFKGWLKLGKANSNYKNRLANYNTSTPYRDFKFKYKKQYPTMDIVKVAEDTIWRKLEKVSKEFVGEWFKVDLNVAINTIKRTNITI